jgi:hypothetical protein
MAAGSADDASPSQGARAPSAHTYRARSCETDAGSCDASGLRVTTSRRRITGLGADGAPAGRRLHPQPPSRSFFGRAGAE